MGSDRAATRMIVCTVKQGGASSEQLPVCVDDYGDLVYRCFYTGAMVSAGNSAITGAMIPGVKARYVMGSGDAAKLARKASSVAFHELDANCNTCKHLQRVAHEKSRAGFVLGMCGNKLADRSSHPYRDRERDGVMMIHPDDSMRMPCYESRWK